MRFLFKTNYDQDVRLIRHNGQRFWYGLLLAAVLLAPLGLDDFYLGELALEVAEAGGGGQLRVGQAEMHGMGAGAAAQVEQMPAAGQIDHGCRVEFIGGDAVKEARVAAAAGLALVIVCGEAPHACGVRDREIKALARPHADSANLACGTARLALLARREGSR